MVAWKQAVMARILVAEEVEGVETFVAPWTDSDKQCTLHSDQELIDSGSSSDFEKQELEDRRVDLQTPNG